MKAIRVPEPRKIEIVEMQKPSSPKGDEVLVRVKMAGICGSDIHIYHGTSPVATYPRVIGHEMVGEIVETGSSIKDLSAGDHIVMDPVISCGHCYPCSVGRTNVCSELRVRGVHVDGGYQEYVLLPRKSVHKISKALPWSTAVLIEPFTIAAQICSRGEVTSRDTVFIMGAGPIGMTALITAKMIGARCIISDIVDFRLNLTKKLGADISINARTENVDEIVKRETKGLGPNVIVDTVCSTKSVEQAIALAPSAGRIVILGFSNEPSQVRQLDITAKELDIRGSRLHAGKFPHVIECFEKGLIDPTPLATHTFHFTEVEAAIKQVENNPGETIKVLLDFS